MKAIITLPLKTFSVNQMYYGNRQIKTVAAKEWSYTVFHELSKKHNQEELLKLREYFDPSKHVYVLNMTAYYPKEILFTKKGYISGRAHDITNWEKPLVDLIFHPKYFDISTPYGCKNLNIDDKFVTDCYSKKRPSLDDNYSIKITLRIVRLDPLLQKLTSPSQHE